MGSGTRARARAIKPRDNLHVEEAHRVSSSPPGEHPAEARLGSSPTRREVDESRLEARADSGAGTSPSSPLARSAHNLELHAERRRRALEADTDVAQPSEPSEPGAQPPRRGADVPGDADILLYVEDDRREHIDRHVSAPSDPTPRNPDTTGRTAAGPAHPGLGNVACDACPSCDDRCLVPGCVTCGGASARRTASTEDIERASTSEGITAEMAAEAAAAAAAAAANPRRDGWGRVAGKHGGGGAAKLRCFTCCMVERHRRAESLWLVANGHVYDATLFMHDHPVGPLPMLRGAGRDNTEDMEMHSGAAQHVWQKLKIGTLVKCPKRGYGCFHPPKERCAVM